MNIIFKKLASILVWHDYFLPEASIRPNQIPKDYNLNDFLEIIPTSQTAKTLRDLKIKILKTPYGIDLYTETVKNISSFTPKNIPEENLLLSFELVVINTGIYHYSILQNQPKIFSVSNFNIHSLTVDNGNGGTEKVWYLNRTIANHQNATNYKLDDFVKKSGSTFLSLKTANNKATSNASFWRNLGTTSYLSEQDAFVAEQNKFYTPDNISVKGKAIKIKNQNKEDVLFVTAANSLNDVAFFDISSFTNGLYHLYINDVFNSYFVKTSHNKTTLCTIEIAVQGNPGNLKAGVTALSKNQMLMGNGQDGTTVGEILENAWVLRILNRSTFWKYIFNKEQIFNNTDLATAGFEKLSTTKIQSLQPKSLTAKGVEVDVGLGFLLPNPTVDSTKILYDLNKKVEKYVSELYINI